MRAPGGLLPRHSLVVLVVLYLDSYIYILYCVYPQHAASSPNFHANTQPADGSERLAVAPRTRSCAFRMAATSPTTAAAAAAAAAPFADVDVALRKMVTDNASSAVIAGAAKLLTAVVKNILSQPAEPKFRSLKKENKAVATKILPCRGALQLLVALGFRSADGVLTMAEERVEPARLQHAQAGLAAVADQKAAADAGARQAAAAAKDAAYKEQQRQQREDKLARDRERQRVAEQRQEFLARRAAEAQAAAAAQAAASEPAAPAAASAAAAATAPPSSAGAAAVAQTAASSSSRRKKSAPKRTAPVAHTAAPASDPAAEAAAAARAAAADEAEAEASKAIKRKQSAEMEAATAEFQQQPKKRRRFSPEDAAQRIKGTHRSQNTTDASGAYGVVGRNAEASARQHAVSEGMFAVTEKKVAVANGGGAKLEVVYRLANGRTEATETVQKFDQQEVQHPLQLRVCSLPTCLSARSLPWLAPCSDWRVLLPAARTDVSALSRRWDCAFALSATATCHSGSSLRRTGSRDLVVTCSRI